MMAFQGWTWEYIDENMTIPRWNAIASYWRRHPPVHELVAGFTGYRPPAEPDAEPEPDPPEWEPGA